MVHCLQKSKKKKELFIKNLAEQKDFQYHTKQWGL